MIKVYVSKNKVLSLIIKQIIEEFNLSKYRKIFIKPNLGGRYPIVNGENTKYDILCNLCKALAQNGCQEIVIGHGSLLNFGGQEYDFKNLISKSGFNRLSKYKIVKFLNLDNEKHYSIKVKELEFNIPEILQSHFYINLCCLKTHMETTVSLSMKNQVGLLLANERMRKHKVDLDKHIAYLAAAVKPGLNIIDGRIGMEGNGPHHGTPKRANIVLCGDDMVEIDSLACSLIGIDFTSIHHIKYAIEEKVGTPISDKQYKNYAQHAVRFRKPDECYIKYHFVRVWPNKACSGCIFMLSDAHKIVRKNPIKLLQFINKFVRTKNFDIVLGKGAEKNLFRYSKNIFAIGTCTKDFVRANNLNNFLEGCPPEKSSIIDYLTK